MKSQMKSVKMVARIAKERGFEVKKTKHEIMLMHSGRDFKVPYNASWMRFLNQLADFICCYVTDAETDKWGALYFTLLGERES